MDRLPDKVIVYSQPPYWVRLAEEGDYMADGSDSGITVGDNIREDQDASETVPQEASNN